MSVLKESILRTQLLDRRKRLAAAITVPEPSTQIVHLLQEVDAALEKLEHGTYGICEVCHDGIEASRLLAHPLARVCLDCLTPREQVALERDLDLASSIQRQLLPQRGVRHDGWQADYHYAPAGPVSGDYCDLIVPQRQTAALLFLLGDVSGKGVAASMLMTHLHAMFRTLIGFDVPLDELLGRANRVFCESTLAAKYATLVAGAAHPDGTVELGNAGHCPPLLVRGGRLCWLGAGGFPLGLFHDAGYEVQMLRLDPGDLLVLYSDGLTEARDKNEAEYGRERLAEIVAAHCTLEPPALLEAVLEDLAAFQPGAPRADDLSLLVLRRAG